MSTGAALYAGVKALFDKLRDETPYVSGRELFDERSITGLNRIPVIKLTGYVLAGARITDEPRYQISLEEIHTTLEVDGSLLMYDGEVQHSLVSATWDSCVQCLPAREIDGETDDVYRVWEQVDNSWQITDYQHWGSAEQVTIAGPLTIEADRVAYYYNAAEPVGILYFAQGTYRRIEEITQTIRKFQKGPATKVGVTGYIRDEDSVRAELMGDDPFYVISGVDTNITMGGNTAAIDQLMKEQERLLPMYYQQTHIVDTESPVQRPSGADRALVIGPMLRYVDTVRAQITNVLAQLGGAWTFERLHTSDVLDRQNEFNLLTQLMQAGILSIQEYASSAKELV